MKAPTAALPRPPSEAVRVASRSLLPRGALAVTGGFLVSGVCAYGFLLISARTLGPAAYAPLSAFWVVVYLLVPGLLLPLEQEVARLLADRRTRGVGGRPVVVRAAALGSAAVGVVVVGTVVARGPLLRTMFDGESTLLVALAAALLGYLAQTLVRGVLAGQQRFDLYALVISVEGVVRIGGALALAVLGVHSASALGLVVGVAPWVPVLVLLPRSAAVLPARGPAARWSELSSALGYLLASSVLTQVLLNLPPLVVKWLAGPGQRAVAGVFIAGAIIARVPLFLYQGVLATLLPNLAALAGAGRLAEVRQALLRLLAAVVGIGVVAVAFAGVAGRQVLSVFFGSGYQGTATDLVMLTAAGVAFMVALTLSQACIALGGHRLVAAGWLVGVLAFAGATARSTGLTHRAEQGFLVGATASAVATGVFFAVLIRARAVSTWTPENPTTNDDRRGPRRQWQS